MFENPKVLRYYYCQFSNRWLKPIVVRFVKSEVTDVSHFVVKGPCLCLHNIRESFAIGVDVVAGTPHAAYTAFLSHFNGVPS